MPGFLEAVVTLFPADAGGRERPIAPRYGNYRPALRTMKRSAIAVRFIEGPPWIAPGQDGRVVAEIEAEAFDDAGLAGRLRARSRRARARGRNRHRHTAVA